MVVGAILRGMVDEMVLTKTENIWRFSITLVVIELCGCVLFFCL